MKTNHIAPCLLTALLLSSANSVAQTQMLQVGGGAAAYVGDINDDGFPDLLVGDHQPAIPAGYANPYTAAPGAARVISGVDGSMLFHFTGNYNNELLGWAVANAGDVNADGTNDLMVGAPGANSSIGNYVKVFSGVDGSTLFTLTVPGVSYLGSAVAGLGDVNGDGYADVFAGGQVLSGSYGSPNGFVFSGSNGAILYSVSSIQRARSAASIGDLNGDGIREFLVGAADSNFSGGACGNARARVFDGASGAMIYQIQQQLYSEMPFGGSVSGLGDVNADGTQDFAVGMERPWSHVNGSCESLGWVDVFSGANGSLIRRLNPASYVSVGANEGSFGAALAGLPDVNGDGISDLAIGCTLFTQPNIRSSRIKIVSGQSGQVLNAFDLPLGSWISTLDCSEDINGDGALDLLASTRTSSNGNYARDVSVFSLRPVPMASVQSIGQACGASALALGSSVPTIGQGANLSLSPIPANGLAFFFASLGAPTTCPLPAGCVSYVDLNRALPVAVVGSYFGSALHTIPIPTVPMLAGIEFTLQGMILESTAPDFSVSNGLHLRLGF